MQITKTNDGTRLTLQISGRLDTTTAPELEKVLSESLDNVTELTLNFAELEYISSAGLRVVLIAIKKMKLQGTMSIINANDLVKEVFDVTGFSDMVDIN